MSLQNSSQPSKQKKINIPGIGMRILKSAIAVAICYVVNMLRGEQGMVFYSQLAALWCIQMYRSNTMQNAWQRTTGTIIGAVYGLIYLLMGGLVRDYLAGSSLMETSVPGKFIMGNSRLGDFLLGTNLVGNMMISLMIIAVLYTTVLLKKKQASYFSCVVFLSIVVNHVRDINPYLFVWNRFLDTMIGIVVGILVNDSKLCIHPQKDTLFISGLDGMLLNQKEMLSAFSVVELNRMIDDGMKFTVSTMRTPAAIMEPMKDVRLQLPVIAMNGAVLYDTQKHVYLKAYVISKETSQKVMELIRQEGLCCYPNVLIEDTLIIYYGDTEEMDPVNANLIQKLRVSPYRNYVKRPLPNDESVVYFMLLDQKEKIKAFYEKLEAEGYTKQLRIITYDSTDFLGYAYIKIYNQNATKDNMIQYLKDDTGLEKVVTFGTIPGQYDVFIDTEDGNRVVREVRKRYEPLL